MELIARIRAELNKPEHHGHFDYDEYDEGYVKALKDVLSWSCTDDTTKKVNDLLLELRTRLNDVDEEIIDSSEGIDILTYEEEIKGRSIDAEEYFKNKGKSDTLMEVIQLVEQIFNKNERVD